MLNSSKREEGTHERTREPRRASVESHASEDPPLLASRQLLSYLTRVTKNFYIRARRALRRQLKYLGGIAARLRARAGVARIKGVKFSVSGPQRILKRRLMEEGRGDAAIKRTGAIRDGLKPDRAR